MKPWTLQDLETRLTEYGGLVGDIADPREKTRQRILDAATEHFVRFGYRRASMGDIAADAGVGKGTVYLYFDGKETLMMACVAREKLTLLPQIAAVLEGPPERRLLAYIEMALRLLFTSKLSAAMSRGDQEIKVLLDDLGDDAKIASDQERSLDFIADLIAAGAPDLSEHQRHQFAALLAAILILPAHLTDPRRLNGLEVEAFITLYASVLARGILSADPV